MATEKYTGHNGPLIDLGLPLQTSLANLKHALAVAQKECEPDKDTGMFDVCRSATDGTDVIVRAVINPLPSVATHSRRGKFSRYAQITVDDGTDNPNNYGLWYCGDTEIPNGFFYELCPEDEKSPWSEGVVQHILGIMSVRASESQ